ncbi:MAG: UDP-N-acetylmuramoyl-L-alanine--D-glutamate ligase [Clostridia bacterium]|nr:UDP-N-acetylmuramoyl-L-alanine--D-glutamate ligase [Clostridia bacterium]
MNEKLNEFNENIKGKKVAIIGLGVSNKPLIEYLYNLGARITVFDNREQEKIDTYIWDEVTKYNLKYYIGEDYLANLKGFDYIFRSPSCRPDLPEVEAEVKRGAILTSEIEMVLKLTPCKTIGITGSDGKTTTTSLIYEILKRKYKCFLGGNIGMPLFTKISEMKPEDIVVLELSSFQLMNMELSTYVAVVTNISPNHLNVHKDYQEYIDAKANIFKYQNENGTLVINYDNDITRNFAKQANGKVVYFSRKEKLPNGVIFDEDTVKICDNDLRRHVINRKDVKIRGLHNIENICAAIAATKDLVTPEEQKQAIMEFTGVEHRLEFVREIDNVKWYNDSIASSPNRTIAGLNSYNERIILIAGGRDKHLDYDPIAKPIIEHVDTLIVMGETAEKIKNAVTRELEKQKKTLNIIKVANVEEAVKTAKKQAKPNEIVLFSPASTSFDMFKNFEERGKKFKEEVNKL